MLVRLRIENFVLIDEVEILLSNGLHIFMGETGSGKSILFDAISFLLGRRADKSYIRNHQKPSQIEATFLIDEKAQSLLSLLDHLHIKDHECTLQLKRIFHSQGNSICTVNDKIITLTQFKSVAEQLLQIHGQNEYAWLLNAKQRISYINRLLNEKEKNVLFEFQDYFIRKKELIIKRNELEEENKVLQKRFNYSELEDILKEIESIQDEMDIFSSIEEEISFLEEIEQISSDVHHIYSALYQEESSVFNQLVHIENSLSVISNKHPKLKKWFSQMEESKYIIEDIAFDIRDHLSDFIYDEEKYNILSQQLDQVNKILYKYRITMNDIPYFKEQIEDSYQKISFNRIEIEKISDQLEEIEQALYSYANKLTQIRQQKADELSKRLPEILKELAFDEIKFDIQLKERASLDNMGQDIILFLVSFNKGMDLAPIEKVGSGGELSRLMLAFEYLLAQFDRIPSLLLDEIDTGISGKAANAMGKFLQKLAKANQLICITHLPTIASRGNHHYLVKKLINKEGNYTQVLSLSDDQAIDAISSMMDGNMSGNLGREVVEQWMRQNK